MMITARSSRSREVSESGGAGTVVLTALAVCATAAAAFFLLSQPSPTSRKPAPPTPPRPESHAAPQESTAAAAAPAPAATPPADSTQKEEPAPDLATIARTPAWWPKQVTLTQPVAVPLVVGGKIAGKAELPAHTVVHLVRATVSQLELEHLNQRFVAPIAATDFLPQATALSRAAAPVASASPAVTTANVARTEVPPPKPVQTPPVAASSTPPKAPGQYRNKALEVMSDIQEKFWNRQTGLYAKTVGGKEPDTVWGAGVMFSAVVGAARNDPGHYSPVLKKFFEGLNGYWDTKAKIPGYEPAPTAGNGHDKYYDDNAWMVITFLEAYELTHSPRYERRADETLDFVLSGWDDTVLNGGIWWHEAREKKSKGKNTCANAPAAVGCLLAARYAQPAAAKQRVEMAQKIVGWTVSNLQLDNGLFADSKGINGEQNKGQLTYNSALMVRAFLGLYRATKKPEYLAQAQRIARAADSFLSKETGAYRDPVKWAHLMVEADLELYRITKEEYLLSRAAKNADLYYETWKKNPPSDLISVASIARALWLMADTETDAGRKFWEAVDAKKSL